MNRIKSRLYELFGTNPLPTEWTYYSLDEGIDWFAYNLEKCKRNEEIRIVSGESDYRFWNHPKVTESISNALQKKKVNIQAIAGPIISVDIYNNNTLFNLGLSNYFKIISI